jgi:hypothetical protein
VIFTIDDDETDNGNGHHHHPGIGDSADAVLNDSPTLNNERVAFEMENGNQMDISAYSFSDDDLSEQLFGWKDPWLPSILISLTLTTPILLGNAFLFYTLTGAAFFATPFLLHWTLIICTARHLVSAKLTNLNSTASRIFSSVVSL